VGVVCLVGSRGQEGVEAEAGVEAKVDLVRSRGLLFRCLCFSEARLQTSLKNHIRPPSKKLAFLQRKSPA
jgi:hypothetical protein